MLHIQGKDLALTGENPKQIREVVDIYKDLVTKIKIVSYRYHLNAVL